MAPEATILDHDFTREIDVPGDQSWTPIEAAERFHLAARTLADLESGEAVRRVHIAEALSYRAHRAGAVRAVIRL